MPRKVRRKPSPSDKVQLNVWVKRDLIQRIDDEARGIQSREGVEPSRSQVAAYLMELGLEAKHRPPIV